MSVSRADLAVEIGGHVFLRQHLRGIFLEHRLVLGGDGRGAFAQAHGVGELAVEQKHLGLGGHRGAGVLRDLGLERFSVGGGETLGGILIAQRRFAREDAPEDVERRAAGAQQEVVVERGGVFLLREIVLGEAEVALLEDQRLALAVGVARELGGVLVARHRFRRIGEVAEVDVRRREQRLSDEPAALEFLGPPDRFERGDGLGELLLIAVTQAEEITAGEGLDAFRIARLELFADGDGLVELARGAVAIGGFEEQLGDLLVVRELHGEVLDRGHGGVEAAGLEPEERELVGGLFGQRAVALATEQIELGGGFIVLLLNRVPAGAEVHHLVLEQARAFAEHLFVGGDGLVVFFVRGVELAEEVKRVGAVLELLAVGRDLLERGDGFLDLPEGVEGFANSVLGLGGLRVVGELLEKILIDRHRALHRAVALELLGLLEEGFGGFGSLDDGGQREEENAGEAFHRCRSVFGSPNGAISYQPRAERSDALGWVAKWNLALKGRAIGGGARCGVAG